MAFPDDFEVPQDQGGPGQGHPVGGFGGNPQIGQDDHRAVVRSAGKAPVILIHGNAGSADIAGDKWNMAQLRERLVSNAYPRELIWALSYLGTSASEQARFDDGGFGPQPPSPHTNNVNEVREFIDNVCEYLGVDFVDIIAHSLGCTLAYSVFRGLSKQGNFDDELKRWNRVGTFVALAGAFRGLTSHSRGEWVPNGEFIDELRTEDLGGGGEIPFGEGKPKTPGPSPHNITYFCGIAEQDFIDAQSPSGPLRTGFLQGAINEGEFLGFQLTGHEAIIKNEAFFNEFLPHLNRVPPVPRATITVDKNSGNYDSPLMVTLNIDPSDKTVDYAAKRVTKEIRNNVLGEEIAETLNGSLSNGQTLTLPTDGMWEVLFSADGADDLQRTYGVGIEILEVTITTDNSTPFEESLNVMATATRGKLYHSDDGLAPQMWIEGANTTITESKVIYFIAIDSDGIASPITSKAFKKAVAPPAAITATPVEHFVAKRIGLSEYLAYGQQFGFTTPIRLCLLNGHWVICPDS
jgi:pimeloyl-ACP methyl ester carboxylesterase